MPRFALDEPAPPPNPDAEQQQALLQEILSWLRDLDARVRTLELNARAPEEPAQALGIVIEDRDAV